MLRVPLLLVACLLFGSAAYAAESGISGRVVDPQDRIVAGATVRLNAGQTRRAVAAVTGETGWFELHTAPGRYEITIEAPGFEPAKRNVEVPANAMTELDLRFATIASQNTSITIADNTNEPALDLRNAEVFNRTLFTRDDQIFQQLAAGINAGQHEGGGKSVEIRRFGFNLDHGGVNGGLKVMVDDVQQNQGTQGHGQGYLGSLKALSPELIQGVTIINGPFSAEYGDFSGLGVVQIRQRESLPDEATVRVEGGNFGTRRAFLAYSPELDSTDAYIAYENSYTDGPFENPLRYGRDNVNGNYTVRLGDDEKLGFRILYGRNQFYSSGQIPLDLVAAGTLDRFGYIDPTDGGKVWLGTVSAYYSKTRPNGDTLRADAFSSRSLFDLYSNFTFYLHDPVHGDAFQQHDSRLQEGSNVQYTHTQKVRSVATVLIAGANLNNSDINVGLYPREGRTPTGVTTRAGALVTNAAGYVQESASLWNGRLLLGGGLRFDEFRYAVHDRIDVAQSGTESAGRAQGKASLAFAPSHALPLTLHLNYGRGINSVDARGVVQHPEQPRLATTDFYQFGTSSNFGRASFTTAIFLIDHSNELVYIPDDGSFEFKGPSRAYGYETKLSLAFTRHLSLSGGLTKIANAFYKGGDHRVYVDSAPHFVADAALTLASWHGWNGSFRMRAINHYRLDGDDPSIVASAQTIFDLGVVRQIRHGIEFNLSVDNLTNRDYYETQNYFASETTPFAPVVSRIHGTPGYPRTIVAGLRFRLGAK